MSYSSTGGRSRKQIFATSFEAFRGGRGGLVAFTEQEKEVVDEGAARQRRPPFHIEIQVHITFLGNHPLLLNKDEKV